VIIDYNFQRLPTFFFVAEIVSLNSSLVHLIIASFLFWYQYFNFYSCLGRCIPFLFVIFC